ncbi:MAG: Nramp family divalent metal transporter [Mycobacterium sp.]
MAMKAEYELGQRPALSVGDLPTPEEVFDIPRLGRRQILTCAIGPSLIALGVSIGGGEWILGPLVIGDGSFKGVFFAVFLSALLQTIYNIEIARYVLATGEVPILGFGRVPPGYRFWIPVGLGVLYLSYIFGGTFAVAGQALYPLIFGHVAQPGDVEVTRLLALAVVAAAIVLVFVAKKVSAALERFNAVIIVTTLLGLVVIDLALVPADMWREAIGAFVTPALPPPGTTATAVGALVGYTALVSGLNWYVMGHYRDKGYGMGHRTGFIAGGRGQQQTVRATGITFPDTDFNREQWKRWMRLLRIDMWVVFFPAALLGMLLPAVLVARLARNSDDQPTAANMPTYVADALGAQYGRALFWVTVVLGALLLVKTAINVFEGLVRVMVDAVNGSESTLGQYVRRDPRRFYFIFMIGFAAVMAVMLHLAVPATLLQISGNMAAVGMLIFPFLVIYLNRRLPEAARPSISANVAVLVCVPFFGFFFLNFLVEKVTGVPMLTF